MTEKAPIKWRGGLPVEGASGCSIPERVAEGEDQDEESKRADREAQQPGPRLTPWVARPAPLKSHERAPNEAQRVKTITGG